MPAPIVPPPANDVGALLIPRELQRWLDINPVTKLDRIGSYLTIPAFSTPVSWNGVSDIVYTIDYNSSVPFSLKSISGLTKYPSFVLAVMYVNYDNSVVRYFLWKGIGEVIFGEMPLYTGQMIKPVFRFEVWSTPQTASSGALILNTSKLGFYDYRWQNDFNLTPSIRQCAYFGTNNLNLPLTFPVSSVPNLNTITM